MDTVASVISIYANIYNSITVTIDSMVTNDECYRYDSIITSISITIKITNNNLYSDVML